MKKRAVVIKGIDFLASIFFFLLANYYFWGALLSILLSSARNPELEPNLWYFFSSIIIAPFLIYGSVIFLRKSEVKYIYALTLLSILLVETQIYRFFFVTNYRLEAADFYNLILFGIPMLVLYMARRWSGRVGRK